jgi:hypothetical protein
MLALILFVRLAARRSGVGRQSSALAPAPPHHTPVTPGVREQHHRRILAKRNCPENIPQCELFGGRPL